MDENNIDKFFQEKFEDFGEVPDENVWKSIESTLDQKKKRRLVLPIWWKLGGVAALLAILFYIIDPFVNNDPSQPINADIEQQRTPQTKEDTDSGKDLFASPDPESGVVQSSDEEDQQFNDLTTEQAIPSTNGTAKEGTKDPFVSKGDPRSNAVNRAIENRKSEVTATDPDNNNTDSGAEEQNNSSQIQAPFTKEKDPEMVITDASETGKQELEEISSEEVVAQIENKEGEDDPKKKSIFDEISEEEEEDIVENNGNKWSAGPSVAPVYFSSFGEGSPIHPNFVANSKSGNLNLSYGLSVTYDISERLSIRSGLHKVDYGYDTNDILFSSSLAASTINRIENIDYTLTSKNLVVASSADSEAVQYDPSFDASNEIAAPSPSRDGRMVQQFGYLEVPVELNYAVVDRKFGVHIIGGFSSLFLVDNAVSLESNGKTTEIGEANNINDLNFSTNIGFGLDYNISPKVQLNLEPMFKYQLKTFSDTSGSFQPFSLGVYSGLNFRF